MAAITVISLFACNNLKETAESAPGFEQELVFTASREGVSPDTKTVRMDDGSTWWNAAEEISVFYGSGSEGGSKFTSLNNVLQEIVDFSGSVTISGSGQDWWAVYPYSADNTCDGTSITTVVPDNQIGSEGNFSGDVFPAIAKSKSNVFAFWNICGGIKFFVSRRDITSVTFKGNNDEVLAGKVKVAFDNNGQPVVTEVLDGKTEVTLTAPDDGAFKAGKYYYLTLLPARLSSGFTLTFNTADSKGVVTSNSVQTVKRSTFGVLKNVDSKVTEWEKTAVEPEAVDLGLPSGLKWATFNVGATKPEEYGDYFAWGETEPKSDYSWASYQFNMGTDWHGPFSKYVTNSPYGSFGTADDKIVLDSDDDVAIVKWGGNWRMPTSKEWDELIVNCTWTWTTLNGVVGRKVTGTNGNSIFLPFAGIWYNTDIGDVGTDGYYWSSSLYSDIPYVAWYVNFDSGHLSRYSYCHRFYGASVRAVLTVNVTGVSIDKTELTISEGGTAPLAAYVLPANATNKDIEWSSSDTSVATVDSDGDVTGVKAGTATIFVTTTEGGFVSACSVTVKEAVIEAIDLGLSVKWASCNVGASVPQDYGDYFAWGEIEPKTEYNWPTYKWCNGDSSTLTKYNTDSSGGLVDNKTVLDYEDDPAYANLGGSWHMPTSKEWEELIEKCNWKWTVQNGVNGYKIKGANGNSIFLPAAGGRNNSTLYYAGSYGNYLSSSLYSKEPSNACIASFDNYSARMSKDSRNFGCSVRPVYDDRIHVESISLNANTLSLYVGDSERLIATVLPVNATDKTVSWSTDNPKVATVDDFGIVKAFSAGTTRISVTTNDRTLTATCVVIVEHKPVPKPEPEAVDLGLSVKWASFNIGATKPEEYGDCFSWGEIEPKPDYSWSSYKWCSGNYVSLTKYNTDISYGFVDNKTALEPEDDAAHVFLGTPWRLPTLDEIAELKSNCRCTSTQLNGVNGWLIISRVDGYTDKFIFIPAAGVQYTDESDFVGTEGGYWTSSLNPYLPSCAYSLRFTTLGIDWYDSERGCSQRNTGFSIRPVCP